MKKCLICETPIEPFISFGPMPIANGFLTADQFAEEPFFELPVAFCPECKMVQLTELVAPGMMFHENYAFFSSTSSFMRKHFKSFANQVLDSQYLSGPSPFVVELGCNDGIMLENFSERGIRHLGIEPSRNVAEEANKKGIRTRTDFFNEQLAEIIVSEDGQADAFLAANVMCHIPDITGVVKGIKKLQGQ